MAHKNNITLEEFGREIASWPLCYAQVRSGLTSPVVTAMRVQKIMISKYYPACAILLDGENEIHISQIQSIEKFETGYLITCGINEDLKQTVFIAFRENELHPLFAAA